MDDARIDQLRREVLAGLGASPTERVAQDLDSRVAALEAAVADLQGGGPGHAATAPRGHSHPSLRVLGPGGGGDRCLMEPDKPCVQSGQCRALGH